MMPVPVWVSPFTALTCQCNCACLGQSLHCCDLSVQLCLSGSALSLLWPVSATVHVWVSPFTALTCQCNCACVRLCLTESARLSLRPGRRIQADMIGRPENDLRHIGHVGYDGVTFGDVSFIGDDYSKLQPVNTRSTNTNGSSSRRESHIAKHTHTYTSSRLCWMSDGPVNSVDVIPWLSCSSVQCIGCVL